MSKWLRSMVSIGLVLAACLTASLPLPTASSAVSTTQMARLAGNGPTLVSTLVNTAPVVDGTISEGEWANPVQITLNGFNNPANTSTAELYIANTTTDLYIAMILSDSTMSSEEIAEINLDANNDGIATAGAEDTLRYEGSSSSDLFWHGSGWASDPQQNGFAKATYTAGTYRYEFTKPLFSNDPSDLSVGLGGSFGFRIETYNAHTFEYYRYPLNTSGHGDVSVEWAKWSTVTLPTLGVGSEPAPYHPRDASTLAAITTTLAWVNPTGTTQVHLQLIPALNDGPGVNLILGDATSFALPSPPGWYGLLPDLGYTWRVRTTASTTFAPEDDPTWGSWSQEQTFRTPVRDSSRLTLVTPTDGATVDLAPQVLQWNNDFVDVYYYEVQVSPDPNFGEQGPVSSVWYNLVHGGVSNPPNSWTTPELTEQTTYYFRVRSRVQGDGIQVAWGPIWSFETR